MQSLYSLIESPPEPSVPADAQGDEAFATLAAYEDPLGVKTPLYKYQIVSYSFGMIASSPPPKADISAPFLVCSKWRHTPGRWLIRDTLAFSTPPNVPTTSTCHP